MRHGIKLSAQCEGTSSRFGIAALVLSGWLVALTGAARGDDGVTIEPREKWSGVFGESEAAFTFDIRSTARVAGRVGWSLSANNRTIARGELPLDAGPAKPATVAVPLKIPPVKEGVTFPMQLTLTVFAKDAAQPAATLVKPLWIYGRDPFVDRTQWLKELALMLYDPDGRTAAAFDKADIPYKETRNIAALAAAEAGLVVIGEAVSLAEHRSLGEALGQLAARGVPVLCLAPADGALVLSAADAPEARPPDRVVLKRRDAITELDKRLDAEAWPPDGQIVAARLAVSSDGDQLLVEVSDSERAWPWLEVWYPARTSEDVPAGCGEADPGTPLVVVGFGIIRHWDASPTPRYLLARLFECLSATPAEATD
jgi:hypothetical protein